MSRDQSIELFVPGRLCLFGEHSDWAGMNRSVNAEVMVGKAIVTGIQEGIYAVVERSDRFIVTSPLPMYNGECLECAMNTQRLLEIAKEGGFFSYVAGVASYINDNYTVGGVKITITKMDLPVKSGLSSSAAICVLVARAFNQLYHLKMNTKGEMQAAFRGEQRTPSRCGRLDQACAYGVRPVLMDFDGVEIESRPLHIGTTFYWVIADLNAGKDTVKILADLNKCFPFAENEKEKRVQEALGIDNHRIIEAAIRYLEQGDAPALGCLMTEAQELFDLKVAPACPEELTAPVLHSVLNDDKIKPFIYGAKGVGSQGDGTVQFLAKDKQSRDELIRYLEEARNMPAFSLTLHPGQSVRKAIIPIAGFGTRLYPATKVVKKAFMPLVDEDGYLKPALLIMLEHLEAAGIEEICLVKGEEEQRDYDEFFAPLSEEYLSKLSEDKLKIEQELSRLRNKITYVYQKERLGFGHAVYICRNFTQNEPVLLLLGDYLYKSNERRNCSKQIIKAFEQCGKTVVSIHSISLENVVHCGILHGQWENEEENLMKVDVMKEKPTDDYAREYLGVRNAKKEKEYLAVFGQYVLTPEVFEQLAENIQNGITSRGEYQLTDALETLVERNQVMAFKPNGTSYDIGLPESYRITMEKY